MLRTHDSLLTIPIILSVAQRKAVAAVAPEVSARMMLEEPNQRKVVFTLEELSAIEQKASMAVRHAVSGMRRNSLRHLLDLIPKAIDRAQSFGAIPPVVRVFQFRISLKHTQPPIWRRIQVKDGTLDRLHEHIQTAMGWTNSHLHHFKINGKLYGDPLLVDENFDEMDYADSTTTKFSEILPRSGERFQFEYEYDFGDCWRHAVLFEGCLRAEPGRRYPFCVEGERACPPEDSGGTPGYTELVGVLADPEDEQHDEIVTWLGKPFDPAAFDAGAATRRMKRGLPDWRRMQ